MIEYFNNLFYYFVYTVTGESITAMNTRKASLYISGGIVILGILIQFIRDIINND